MQNLFRHFQLQENMLAQNRATVGASMITNIMASYSQYSFSITHTSSLLQSHIGIHSGPYLTSEQRLRSFLESRREGLLRAVVRSSLVQLGILDDRCGKIILGQGVY